MGTREQIDAFARERMGAGELLTWRFDEELNEVTFYVPLDTEADYPPHIEGTRVVIRKIPRPLRSYELNSQ